MTEGIEAVTTAALGMALDAASLRHQAIAANIANSNVAGYVPVTLNFESQLDDARRALESNGQLDAASLRDVVPRLESESGPTGVGITSHVMLDTEVARLAQNGVQYQALMTGLTRHFAIMSLAVNDGKK
jgi:flagellar basal-body rod protein FlgB